ncbi:MAG TPA: hypothetical protein VNS08_14745 [Ureibacillus sp.]|nr:hypothetical protein [Ureibacillus sp.]
MRISTARYITENDIKMLPITQMTKKKYSAIYKGRLYCPTANCPAKLSYSSGNKGHYKTWRNSNHSPVCPFNLERDGIRIIGSNDLKIAANISKKHKQNALMRAYKSMEIDELNVSQETQVTSQLKNNRLRKMKSKTIESAQMTLFEATVNKDLVQLKGKKLLSRFVHEVGTSDIGKNRIIKGFIKNIELQGSTAEIIVDYQNKEMLIDFNDDFTKEPLNKSYLNKFWAVQEWMNRQKKVSFIGMGEVHMTKDNEFELIISMGTDFKVDGEDLYNLARKIKVEIVN